MSASKDCGTLKNWLRRLRSEEESVGVKRYKRWDGGKDVKNRGGRVFIKPKNRAY